MFWTRKTCLLFCLLSSLTLWCKTTSAGSSFLSPLQKPPNRGKSSRVGRQVMEEPRQPTEDNQIRVSGPFDIGITLTPDDFEEYGMVLKEIIQRLLGNTETAENPPHL